MFVEAHNPNQKGNVAELAIAKEAAELGLSVFAPLTEHERYDLIFGVKHKLLRIQCKWASCQGRSSVFDCNRLATPQRAATS